MKTTVVEVKNISFKYEDQMILDGINLSVQSNDFLGIIGPNGGGKTTLLKIMLGLLAPSHGEIKILGKTPLESLPKIGYVPQVSRFDRDFPINVLEVVLMGRLVHAKRFHDFSSHDKEIALEALKMVGMEEMRERQIGKLSEGQKQRIFIARALATQPQLLLLDEPTASVDTTMQAGLYDLLVKMKEKMTVIMVTHDIGVISSHVDKIACLNCKLFYHGSHEISKEDLEAAYQCPVDMIAHGVPHRVMKDHKH
jgi:zinc transport system ATP-binding protein